MGELTVLGAVLRFLLGGGSVALAFLLSRRFGGWFGGIFAAFPGVYLASTIAVGVGHPIEVANSMVVQISEGALLGMFANIAACLAAGWLIPKGGYIKGLASALLLWALLGSAMILAVGRS